MVLVANKNDMEESRTVKTSKGKQVSNLDQLLSVSRQSFRYPHLSTDIKRSHGFYRAMLRGYEIACCLSVRVCP